MKKIVTALFTPLLYLNMAGMAAGAVWLGIVHQWQVIGIGVIALLFSPYLLPICMIPAGILSHFMAAAAHQKDARKERRFFISSTGYVLLVLTLWCVAIFFYATRSVRPDALFPALVWGNAAGLTPLFLWAARDRANTFMATLVEVAQAGLLLLSALRLAGVEQGFFGSFATLYGVLALAAGAQALYESKHLEKQTKS